MAPETNADEQILVFDEFKHLEEVTRLINSINKVGDDIREEESLEDALKR